MRHLIAIAGCLFALPLHADDPLQRGRAAWAIAVAKLQLSKTQPMVHATCPCSRQCVCGCQTGQGCRCGNTSSSTGSGCTIVHGVMVCPGR